MSLSLEELFHILDELTFQQEQRVNKEMKTNAITFIHKAVFRGTNYKKNSSTLQNS